MIDKKKLLDKFVDLVNMDDEDFVLSEWVYFFIKGFPEESGMAIDFETFISEYKCFCDKNDYKETLEDFCNFLKAKNL